MKKDPNHQEHHTFGDSPAAETLKKEIDKGARYKAAVAILNKGNTLANNLTSYGSWVEANSDSFHNGKFFLQLLREHINKKINESSSDEIIKSLCRNIFTKKYRSLLKLSMFK